MLSFDIRYIMIKDWRIIFLLLALGVYGLWGSATPNNPAWPEFLICAFMIGALGFSNLLKPLTLRSVTKITPWRLSAWFLFLYALCVPSIVALVDGATLSLMIRDIIALFFLCLPLFLYDFLKKKAGRQDLYLKALIFIALAFSMRVLFPHLMWQMRTGELLYLANSPLVLFSALFLFSLSFKILFDKANTRHFLLFCLYMGMAGLASVAMFVDVQRATFIALSLTILSLFFIGFVKAPLKAVFLLALLGACGFFLIPFLSELFENVALKTAKVGLNMRLQEFYAVWDLLGTSWVHVLFGYGWGSSFASPAVGGVHVTYTHSLLSYMFLKTGMVGLFLCLVYLFFMFEKLSRLYFTDPVKGNALIWALFIPTFFYASYKSFDFGLLLTLILVIPITIKSKIKTDT